MPYWRLYYHLVWATYKREPLLDPTREQQVFRAINGKAKDLDITIHALGCVDNHIHVVASIPPKIAVARCVGQLKGASSRCVNQLSSESTFAWQDGYGALSFEERALRSVIEYVVNQKSHHAHNAARPAMERITEDND